jgi:Polyketide cyclase / dehydrase and lipid transport
VPRYRVSIESTRAADEVFAYLAGFDNIRDWDPSVASARRFDDGDVRIGSVFEVTVRMRARELPLRYAVVRLEQGRLVALEAHARWFRSYDVITVEPSGAGSLVGYDALLELKGLARLATPFLGRAFRTIGDAATDGLRRALTPG